MFESLAHQFRPICNGHSQILRVYQIELLLKGPRLFGVVYFELDICRDPFWFSLHDTRLILACTVPGRLNGAQVSTDDLRIRKLIAHLNSPDACSSSQVKNPCRFFAKGGQVEFVAHCYAYHLMCEVKAIQFALQVALAGDG